MTPTLAPARSRSRAYGILKDVISTARDLLINRTPGPPRADGFVFLRDQEPLSAKELDLSRQAVGWVRDVLDSRPSRLAEAGLDPAIWMPAGNWDVCQPFYDGVRMLLKGENFDYLRLFAQQFTGYHLFSLGELREHPMPRETILEIDQYLEEHCRRDECWVQRYALLAARLPASLRISPPKKFGEIGWTFRKALINFDTFAYLERVALLYQAGLLDERSERSILGNRPLRVLEIGAGYGGLASFLMRIFPRARYTIVDIPESLAYSGVYLSVLFAGLENQYGIETPIRPTRGFTFVPNFDFPRLAKTESGFDLVINTLSMSEMTEPQVRAYCEGISRLIGQTGIFFEQNQDNRMVGLLNAQEIIAEYFPNRISLGGPDQPVSLENGFANLWTHRRLPALSHPRTVFKDDRPPMLVGSGQDANIVRFSGKFYVLPKKLGAIDFYSQNVTRLPGVRVFSDLDAARSALFAPPG